MRSSVFEGLTALALIIITIILAIAFKGFVLSVLWEWFITPVFGLPLLSISQSLGVALVVTSLVPTPKESSAAPFIGPAIVLVFGWILHLFI